MMNEKCPVCYERDGNKKVCKNKHCLCYECYREIMKENEICPYCREKMIYLSPPFLPVFKKRKALRRILKKFIRHRHFLLAEMFTIFDSHPTSERLLNYQDSAIHKKFKNHLEKYAKCSVSLETIQIPLSCVEVMQFHIYSQELDQLLATDYYDIYLLKTLENDADEKLLSILYNALEDNGFLELYEETWPHSEYETFSMILYLQYKLNYKQMDEQKFKEEIECLETKINLKKKYEREEKDTIEEKKKKKRIRKNKNRRKNKK